MVGILFVEGLGPDMTNEHLTSIFSRFGHVVFVDVVMDLQTGKCTGRAYVEMSSEVEAGAAMAALNGQEVNGRTLFVDWASQYNPF